MQMGIHLTPTANKLQELVPQLVLLIDFNTLEQLIAKVHALLITMQILQQENVQLVIQLV
jgi:hypothetical protein